MGERLNARFLNTNPFAKEYDLEITLPDGSKTRRVISGDYVREYDLLGPFEVELLGDGEVTIVKDLGPSFEEIKADVDKLLTSENLAKIEKKFGSYMPPGE